MNCQSCQNELDAYREGKLPRDMITQVESHLNACKTCAWIYRLQILAERVMDREKEIEPDPFLSTRIMARIEYPEESGYKTSTLLKRVLKPVLGTASIAAAILLGIMLGNLSHPAETSEAIPIELALIDDAAIESINLLSTE